jgi:sulfate/thiosulfate transport system substrate-binding protein
MSSIRHFALAALASALFAGSAVAKDYELLNVSYDPTRELYQGWLGQTGSCGDRRPACRRGNPGPGR